MSVTPLKDWAARNSPKSFGLKPKKRTFTLTHWRNKKSMPIYDYSCPECGKSFEAIKGIKDYDLNPHENCPHCSHLCGSSDRDFSRCSFNFTGTSVESAEYNPGLGKIVKNKYHKSEIMKEKGLVEVGNDYSSGDKMQKHFEQRKKEEREKSWEKV